MATTIITKYGSGAPTASDVVRGELAVDTENGRLYTETSGGAVIEIGLNPSGNVDVTGTVTADGLTVDGATDGTAIALLRADNTAVTKKNTLRFEDTDTTTQNDQQIGRIEFYSNDTDHTGVDAVIEAVSATTGLKELRFLTSDTANTPLSRLAINKGGDINFYEDTGTNPKLVWKASDERLGIGTDSPARILHTSGDLVRFDNSGTAGILLLDTLNNEGFRIVANKDSGAFSIEDMGTATSGAGTERLRIDSSGNVGIGTSSPSRSLHVSSGTTNGNSLFESTDSECYLYIKDSNTTSDTTNYIGAVGDNLVLSSNVGIGTTSPSALLNLSSGASTILRLDDTNGTGSHHIIQTSGSNGQNLIISGDVGGTGSGSVIFRSNASSEAMRIDSSQTLLVGKTSSGLGTAGIEMSSATGEVGITRSGAEALNINRLSTDGQLVRFFQDTSLEGDISVSGSTVSYNGFSGNHETSGIPTDTEIGTVCSTIDELDVYVSGTKEGQTRTNHAKIKVSDTVGDTRVYGVLANYSENDNKPIVASVGIGSIKVTGACRGGDLLESNGDGTAKVQTDDIIRSKTIGKVTIGSNDTAVKLVPCVLYCG